MNHLSRQTLRGRGSHLHVSMRDFVREVARRVELVDWCRELEGLDQIREFEPPRVLDDLLSPRRMSC